MRIIRCGLPAALLLAFTSVASAEEMDHSKMKHGTMAADPADTPATKAYKEADMAMHKAMTRSYTGDPDEDFLTGMVPHHQGAVDMAKIVLKYGKDPDVRKLAQSIVENQEMEILVMNSLRSRLKAK